MKAILTTLVVIALTSAGAYLVVDHAGAGKDPANLLAAAEVPGQTLPPASGSEGLAAGGPQGTPMLFGMDAASIDGQTALGVKPDLGTMWIGPWTLTSGWGGPDAELERMKAAGVTPAIHFYYWGDDISRSCLEKGCWSSLHNAQKTQAGWGKLEDQLTSHLSARMGGKPVVIYLETEFNKADTAGYEPLDAQLADMADRLHDGYPQAQVVLALGNWNSGDWKTWDRAAAASDRVGIQGMRGSTRDTAQSMDGLYEATLAGAKTAKATFGKPVVIQDVAVSSYPEASFTERQGAAVGEFFAGMADLKAAGVTAIVYRSLEDTPGMDLANYYGEAERHWGLAWTDGTLKPAGTAWVEGVTAERADPAIAA